MHDIRLLVVLQMRNFYADFSSCVDISDLSMHASIDESYNLFVGDPIFVTWDLNSLMYYNFNTLIHTKD